MGNIDPPAVHERYFFVPGIDAVRHDSGYIASKKINPGIGVPITTALRTQFPDPGDFPGIFR
jgi:hypothetical protein